MMTALMPRMKPVGVGAAGSGHSSCWCVTFLAQTCEVHYDAGAGCHCPVCSLDQRRGSCPCESPLSAAGWKQMGLGLSFGGFVLLAAAAAAVAAVAAVAAAAVAAGGHC